MRLFERDELQDRLERAGIPVTALGLSGRRAGRTWPWAAARLHAELRRWRPDVVHTTLFTANLVGQLAARPLRIPVVSSFNRTGEIGLQRALQPGIAGWRGRTMQAIARRAARSDGVRFRAVSAYARDSNCELFHVPPARVTVVPRGIDVEPQSPAVDRSAFGLRAGVPLFVNVARMVPEKAQHLLVEAFADVRAALPDAELAVAGAAGSAAPDCPGRRRPSRSRRRRPPARLAPGRAALVAAADVFVFSSLSEGSPSAVLEAMALGTPVVAFDIAPVVELTGGHARLVPAGSTGELGQGHGGRVHRPGSGGHGAFRAGPGRSGSPSPTSPASSVTCSSSGRWPSQRGAAGELEGAARPGRRRGVHRHRAGLGRGAPSRRRPRATTAPNGR